jgi:excinuclease ABC subunit B
MQRAIEETGRRRQKQIEFNLAHGIEPKSIVKKVTDVMEGAREAANDPAGKGRGKGRGKQRVAEPGPDYASFSPDQAAREIKRLEQQMYKHAQDLEFEQAAALRDQIRQVRDAALGG